MPPSAPLSPASRSRAVSCGSAPSAIWGRLLPENFDHVGGNALIPNATMIVQRCEWDASRDPDIAARHGYDQRDFDLGHKLLLIDGEHDVFGDGSVVCLPTYGHTPGHQSFEAAPPWQRNRTRRRCPAISAGLSANAACRLPRFVHDRKAMLASLGHLARSTSDWPLKGRGHREPRPASVIQC
jgi:hypothetical protein